MRGIASITAEVVCFMRALEARRSSAERVLDDPYAEWFLGPVLRTALAGTKLSGELGMFAERMSPGLTAFVITRHRWMDDCFREALSSGGIEQVVLLGAGYDTRAYRFAELLGKTPVFEVDHPATSARKAAIIADHKSRLPEANVRVVEIDFLKESLAERLSSSGFKRGARTFFFWEGVSMYLSRRAVEANFHTLAEIGGPGSQVVMDFWYLLDSPDVRATAHRLSPHLLHFLGEPITFGIHPEDVPQFLERNGLHLRALADATELESRYIKDGRHVYPANYVVNAEIGAPR
ncbi:MAG: SAM-dependent methyltransferase [Myxococcota bacterium]